MSDNSPFRSELDAAHRRIEQLEAEHAARTKKLEDENARLRQRLIDQAPSRTRTGRTFGALGVIILSLSLAVGIVFARVTGAPVAVSVPQVTPVELAPVEMNEPADPSDFDRQYVAGVLDRVNIHDCVKPADSPASGHIKLLISPTGTIASALVDQGPLRDTPAGACIEERFRGARVPPFTGAMRAVGRSFHVP